MSGGGGADVVPSLQKGYRVKIGINVLYAYGREIIEESSKE